MKYIKYILAGMVFGIILIKSEAVSWFRIQEMFRFQSFHMYGIIGSAVVVGIVSLQLIKYFKIKTIDKQEIDLSTNPPKKVNTLLGGIIFGLGWALVGGCPGPLYALVGAGNIIYLIPIIGLLLGTMAYGLIKNKLPH
ncbi:MAG: DUF6691 family protein [Vicingaceae bacterium]